MTGKGSGIPACAEMTKSEEQKEAGPPATAIPVLHHPPPVIPAKAGIQLSGDAMRGGWTYILASKRNGTLYTGVTSDLPARMWQHRDRPEGFVKRHGVRLLVHAEEYPTIDEAIAREKAVKKWNRAWKLALIERDNPDWEDLFERIV
jgi:putative endonuclease